LRCAIISQTRLQVERLRGDAGVPAWCLPVERSNEPRRSMELEERLSYLENVRDWQGLVEELEKGDRLAGRQRVKAGSI
jgi:hypothetical protein